MAIPLLFRSFAISMLLFVEWTNAATTTPTVVVFWPTTTTVPAQCEEVTMSWTSSEGISSAGMFIEGHTDFEKFVDLPAGSANLTSGTFSFIVDVPWSTVVAVEIFTPSGAHATTPFETVQPGSSLSCLSATGASLASGLGLFSSTTTTTTKKTTTTQPSITQNLQTATSSSSSSSMSSTSQTTSANLPGAATPTPTTSQSSSSSAALGLGAVDSLLSNNSGTNSTSSGSAGSSPTAGSDTTSNSTKSSSTGAIIGASVGAAVFLAVIAGLGVIWNRNQRSGYSTSSAPPTTSGYQTRQSGYTPSPSVVGYQYPYNNARSEYSPVTVQYGAQKAWEQSQQDYRGADTETINTLQTPTMRGLPEIMEDRSQNQYYSSY